MIGEKDPFMSGGAETMPTNEVKKVETIDFLELPKANYLGRINFGDGNIDASEMSAEDYMSQVDWIANNALVFTPDIRQLYGGCMDGRSNIITDGGNEVLHRPKVIGGPSLFAWYVASIGNFSVLEGSNNPIEQFTLVNKILKSNGFRLGMHRECGAARGIVPVLEHYANNQSEINSLIGAKAKSYADYNNGIFLDQISEGVENTYNLSRSSEDFIEESMLEIVKDIDGPDAVINLAADHEHPTHGHDEKGLIFVRVKNGVVYKDVVNENTGVQSFYQNIRYAKSIIETLVRTPEELGRGLIIAEQLPIAAVSTLGRNQHVSEITGNVFAQAA